MLTLDLEIQNDMYFSVDCLQWRSDESYMILLALTLDPEMFWILNVTF
jgi:hypothetical protein